MNSIAKICVFRNAYCLQRNLAGHAHWQNVAKIKGANDAKKSKLLTAWIPKIRKESKNESDLTRNPSLRRIVEEAETVGVPKSSITSAINAWKNKEFQEVKYGVQGGDFTALIECATTSVGKMKNDIQTLLRRVNYQYASVEFQFDKVKEIICELPDVSDDDILEIALLCGTEEYIVSFRYYLTIIFKFIRFTFFSRRLAKAFVLLTSYRGFSSNDIKMRNQT